MPDPDKTPKLTCGSIALAGLLAVIAVVALQRQNQPPTWASTGAAAVAVVAAFVIARGVQNVFWALLAATLLTLHPAWSREAENHPEELLAGAVVLAGLAGVRIGWHLAFYPRFAWRAWLPLLAFLPMCIGLAWKADKHLGVLAAVLCASGLIAATLLAAGLQERQPEVMPSRLNVLTGLLGAVLGPVGGLVVYRFLDRSLAKEMGTWDWLRDSLPESVGMNPASLDGWSWPDVVVVLTVVAVSLGFALYRGWKQWSTAQAPAAWFLPCCAAVMLAGFFIRPQASSEALPVLLTGLVVLLFVFFIAEMLQLSFRRMVLLPPDERLEVQEVAK
jgi:hypothetical protein